MMLFVAYAVLVWWAALKWRRHWIGFAAAGAGVLGVWFIGKFYLWLGGMFGVVRTESFLLLLIPFGGIVGLIGVYIAMLPVRRDEACRRCGYSLRGLEPQSTGGALVCPECGTRHAIADAGSETCGFCGGPVRPHGHRDWVCTSCGMHLLHAPIESPPEPGALSAEQRAMHHAQGEHAQRNAQHDQQAQPEKADGIDGADERNSARLRALRDQIIRKAQPVDR